MASMLIASIAIGACTPEEPEGPVGPDDEGKVPSVKIVADTVTATTATFTITPADAEQVRYAYYAKTADFTAPSYTDVLAQGIEVSATEATTITIEELTADQKYVIMAAAKGNNMTVGQTIEVTPTAESADPEAGEPEELNLTFTSAEYDGGWIDYGMQYIYFACENYQFNLFFETADPIVAGTYTAAMLGEPNTFSNFSSFQFIETDSLYAINDGTLLIEQNGDNYKFTFDLEIANQEKTQLTAVYEGVVDGMGGSTGGEDPEDPENPGDDSNAPTFPELPDGESDSEFFTVAWVSSITETLTTLEFATTYGTKILSLPIYPFEGYEGTYVVGWEGNVGEIDYMTAGCSDGGYPNPGILEDNVNTVTISRSGENWKVDFNLGSMSDTDPIVGTYEGPITGLE